MPGYRYGVRDRLRLQPAAQDRRQRRAVKVREYGADRGGAEISGTPRALASALAKLAREGKIDPLVTAKKLKVLREGADLASSRL